MYYYDGGTSPTSVSAYDVKTTFYAKKAEKVMGITITNDEIQSGVVNNCDVTVTISSSNKDAEGNVHDDFESSSCSVKADLHTGNNVVWFDKYGAIRLAEGQEFTVQVSVPTNPNNYYSIFPMEVMTSQNINYRRTEYCACYIK